MNHLLSDNHVILVRWDTKGNLEAWIMEPPEVGVSWPVCRSLAGISCYKAMSPDPLLSLARWMLLVCCGRETVEACDCALLEVHLQGEKSAVWTIPVAAVRGFVEQCRTPEMDLAQ